MTTKVDSEYCYNFFKQRTTLQQRLFEIAYLIYEYDEYAHTRYNPYSVDWNSVDIHDGIEYVQVDLFYQDPYEDWDINESYSIPYEWLDMTDEQIIDEVVEESKKSIEKDTQLVVNELEHKAKLYGFELTPIQGDK